jgi:hypothetical protein
MYAACQKLKIDSFNVKVVWASDNLLIDEDELLWEMADQLLYIEVQNGGQYGNI